MHIRKPKEGEYNPYFATYINKAPEGDPVQLLREQERELLEEYGSFSEEQGSFRYGEGKWSLKEMLGHIADTERVMSYRLLRVARGDTTPLPGFDQDLFVKAAGFDRRPLAELIAEFRSVRAATVSLLQGLTEEDFSRAGVVSNASMTAAALAYIIFGHAQHHLAIVRERYVPHLQ
jgi:uncharacterized damage-inducible protein DinB